MCGSDTYLVHKATVCPQSDFFKAACRPDTFAEGISGIIDISASSGRGGAFYAQPCKVEDFDWDLDVETTTSVKLMIHYLYHHDYDVEETDADRTSCLFSAKQRKGALIEHSRMCALGEKYGISGLKTVAREKFIKQTWHRFSHAGLSAATIIAYSTTPETDKGLQDVVMNTLFASRVHYSDDEEIQQIISGIPELGYGLFRALLKREMNQSRLETDVCRMKRSGQGWNS